MVPCCRSARSHFTLPSVHYLPPHDSMPRPSFHVCCRLRMRNRPRAATATKLTGRANRLQLLVAEMAGGIVFSAPFFPAAAFTSTSSTNSISSSFSAKFASSTDSSAGSLVALFSRRGAAMSSSFSVVDGKKRYVMNNGMMK